MYAHAQTHIWQFGNVIAVGGLILIMSVFSSFVRNYAKRIRVL